MKKKTIFFIVGTSFSGSTLFGSSLYGDEVTFLGETDRFRPFDRQHANYTLSGCTVCKAQSHADNCPLFGQDRINSILQKELLLDKYLELVSAAGELVVDSSKNIQWLNDLAEQGLAQHVQIIAVVLTRNPVAYSYSAAEATGRHHWEEVVAWRETYTHVLRSLVHKKIPFITMQYENMFNPAVSSLISQSLSNMSAKSIVLNLSKSRISHSLGGNLGAYIAATAGMNHENINKCSEFDNNDLWKFEYYSSTSPIESKRWVGIGKQKALDLLAIPGVIDLSSFMGYGVADLIKYFEI